MSVNLLDNIEKYKQEGLEEIYASAKVCQDIVLTHLFNSKYKEHVTLKGGIVMYNLIKTMLNDDNYRIGLMNRKNNWLEIDAKELCTVIISYLDSLVTVEI